MKSRIEESIRCAQEAGRCAFIPFVTGGFPDSSTCMDIIVALAESGADVIEVGLPFSDPLADGPTIQGSSQTALENGITPRGLFDIIAEARQRIRCPLVLMTYVNPVFKIGAMEFASEAKKAGVAGVIIPDLPPEEADEWIEAAHKNELDTIFLVAPTTPIERLKMVGSKSSGFLYYVPITGVTGSDCTISHEMVSSIQQARTLSKSPVAVGFGISTPEQARTLAKVADGVIVGSALIREIQAYREPQAQVEAVARLAASLSAALVHASNGGE
jgi:tryptophan synthase alpha chain